jgi:Fur family transcriptional regulator, ferric uptake regulator
MSQMGTVLIPVAGRYDRSMSSIEQQSEPAPATEAARREWTEAAFAALAARGHRSGGARTAVIELLGAEGGCLDAEAVAARLRTSGRAVGTASVYRALGVLADLGLLHKVALPDAPVRFELVLPGGDHHHHIVCDACGKTVAFSDEDLESAVEQISRRAAFEVEAHEVTLHGTCEACLSA